jgi:histidine triad (HIT) family protein
MGDETECLFCQIASGALGTEFVYASETVVAFNDLAPQASYHVLVVPKRHIASIDAVTAEDGQLMGEVFAAIQSVAETRGLSQSGYRVITNHGKDAGQSVGHLHFHALGGNDLGPLIEK